MGGVIYRVRCGHSLGEYKLDNNVRRVCVCVNFGNRVGKGYHIIPVPPYILTCR